MDVAFSIKEKPKLGLSPGERKFLEDTMRRVRAGDFEGMILEKLKQRNDIFRVRNGDMRILYREENGAISVLALERRSDSKK